MNVRRLRFWLAVDLLCLFVLSSLTGCADLVEGEQASICPEGTETVREPGEPVRCPLSSSTEIRRDGGSTEDGEGKNRHRADLSGVDIIEPSSDERIGGDLEISAAIEGAEADQIREVRFRVERDREKLLARATEDKPWETRFEAEAIDELRKGPHKVIVEAEDVDGDVVRDGVDIFIDNTGPTIEITEPQENAEVSHPLVLEATVSVEKDSALTDVGFSIDGEERQPYEPPIRTGTGQSEWSGSIEFDISSLSSGEHTLKVIAVDEFGQTTDKSIPFIKREAVFVRPKSGASLVGNRFTFAIDSSAPTSYELAISGRDVTLGQFTDLSRYTWEPSPELTGPMIFELRKIQSGEVVDEVKVHRWYAEQMGGDGRDGFSAVTFDPETERLFVGGTIEGAVTGIDHRDGMDGFIASYNRHLRERTIVDTLSGPDKQTVSGLAFDSTGELIAAGATKANFGGLETVEGEMAFGKRLPRGTETGGWMRALSDRRTPQQLAPIVVEGGLVYMAGFTGHPRQSHADAFVDALAVEDGAVADSFDLAETESNEIITCVAVGPDRDVYVGGLAEASLLNDATEGGLSPFVAKLNSNLSGFEWVEMVIEARFVRDIAIASAGSERVVFAAGTTATASREGQDIGEQGVFAMKLAASSGTRAGFRTYGTSGEQWESGIAIGRRNQLYVTGTTNEPWAGQPNAGGTDIYVMKLQPDLSRKWLQVFGTSKDDSPMDISLHSGLYVFGSTKGGIAQHKNAGNRDAFILKH